ncbi:hypothetical protein APY03_4522 [Variovorax sp. WDL1]|nr:hypothetical protein APY03_4522 [Variovorax sp. WDL1]
MHCPIGVREGSESEQLLLRARKGRPPYLRCRAFKSRLLPSLVSYGIHYPCAYMSPIFIINGSTPSRTAQAALESRCGWIDWHTAIQASTVT